MVTAAIFGWMATALSLGGLALNSRKVIWCWPVWIVGSGVFLVLAILRQDWPQVALWASYEVLNVLGWRTWYLDGKKKPDAGWDVPRKTFEEWEDRMEYLGKKVREVGFRP
jgi:hypothetical protein